MVIKNYGSVELLDEEKDYGSVKLLSKEITVPTPIQPNYGSVELLPKPQNILEAKGITNPTSWGELGGFETSDKYGTVSILSEVPTGNELPSQQEVQKYFVEKYKPLKTIPKTQGYLTKEQIEDWGKIQREQPQATTWEYKPFDVSYKKYHNVVSNLLFNYLQHCEFAVANTVDALIRGDKNIVVAALNGLTGKEKRDWYDVATGLGFDKWMSLAIGMIAGIKLDPVNYIPWASLYKSLSTTIGKTKAMEAIKDTSVVNFLRKGFTSGEGAPPTLSKLVKTLKRYKRYDEGQLYEEIEGLSKELKTIENAELLTQVRAGKIAIEDLSPENLAVLKHFDAEYARIGKEAVGLGILKEEDLIEGYQHNYYEDLTRIGSNFKNGHAGAPAFAKMRNAGNFVDASNARLDLIKNVTKSIDDEDIDGARKLIEEFPMANGTTLVKDASTFTSKQILDMANKVPKPNLNALEDYGYYKLEYTNALYRQKFINTVLDPQLPYATPISKMTSKTVRPGNAIYAVKYRLPDINLKESDEAGIALWKQIVANADNDIFELQPKLTQEILDSPYMQKLFKGVGPRIFEMPKEIVDYMNKSSQLFSTQPETLGKILSSATRIQNMWKPFATIARPFWHVRNVTFNQFQLYLSGVSPFDLLPRAIEAEKAMKGKEGVLETLNYGNVDLKKLGLLAKKNGLFGVGFAGGDIASQAGAVKKIEEAAAKGMETGINLKDILGGVKQLGLKPAEFFEDNAHMVGFLDYIAKADDPDLDTAVLKATEHAFKYLFDYGDLSGFEKSTMRLIDPFYSWHRKAIGLYAEELFEQPQKFANIGKLRKTLSRIEPETEQEKALKPEWMEEQGYIKVPSFISKFISKKPIYFYLAMPPDDLDLLTSVKNMVNVLTPYKTIAELIIHTKSFPEFGTKIEGYVPAPAWMTHLPEKTWKLLKLRPGRTTDYSTGKVTNVLQIPTSYLYAIETAIPTLRDLHSYFPQPIELARDKATVKTWSQATGLGLVNENLNQWRNTIMFDLKAKQDELNKKAKIFEGIKWNGQVYNYINETAEGQQLQREIKELIDKLRVK
jgi:hypothetical protein